MRKFNSTGRGIPPLGGGRPYGFHRKARILHGHPLDGANTFTAGCETSRLTFIRCLTILPPVQRNLGHLLALAHERAHRWLATELAAAGPKGLAPSHGDVLSLLFDKGEATMHEIAAFARRTKPTTTVLVDKLEALGYVTRKASKSDARSVVVRLTPAGESLRPAFDEISRRFVRFLYAGLDRKESETLERLLEKTLSQSPNNRKTTP